MYGERYVFNITSEEEEDAGGKEMEADWGEGEIEGSIGQLIPRERYFIRKLRKIKVTLAVIGYLCSSFLSTVFSVYVFVFHFPSSPPPPPPPCTTLCLLLLNILLSLLYLKDTIVCWYLI